MGSHDPFGHLKHKLWPKEGSEVKLAIWFPTIKSRELTRFLCVQMVCDIPLKSSWQGLQLCFKPHLNPRSSCKVMGPKVAGVPTVGIWKLPFGSPGTKCHLDVGLLERHKVYYKGEGGGFPQVQAVVSLVNPSCPWLVLAPKVLQLCTNHLMLILCMSVWIFIRSLSSFLVPSRSSNTPLYPSKMLRAKDCALIPYSSIIFSLDSHLSPLRSLGMRQ
jgi:hypothetical protein